MENKHMKTIEISNKKLENHINYISDAPHTNYLNVINEIPRENKNIHKSNNEMPKKPDMNFDIFGLSKKDNDLNKTTYSNNYESTESRISNSNMTPISNTSTIRNIMNHPIYNQNTSGSQTPSNVFVPRYDQLESKKEKNLPDFLFKISSKIKMGNIINIIFFGIVLISSLIAISIMSIMSLSFGTFIIPSFLLMLSIFKLFDETKNYKKITNEIKKYKQNQENGIYTLPRFMEKLNEKLHYKQVSQNWISLTIYVTLGIYMGMSLLFASLIGDWIDIMYNDKFDIIMLFCFSILLVTAVYHLFSFVSGNNKIEQIYSYYGKNVPSEHAIELVRIKAKKKYKTLFIISIILITLVPVIVYLFSKKFRGKTRKIIIQ